MKLVSIPTLLLLSGFIILSTCDLLKEPDYLKVYKQEIPSPSDIVVQQIDALILSVNWRISKEKIDNVDGFIIERFASEDSILFPIDDDSLSYQLFDSHMQSLISSSLIVPLSDTSLSQYDRADSVYYQYSDATASFNSWNYYRVTSVYGDLRAFSIIDTRGVKFYLPKQKVRVNQLYDWGLQFTWSPSEYEGIWYKITRSAAGDSAPRVWDIPDTTFIDSSENPQYNVCNDSVYLVDGLLPNTEYQYEIILYSKVDPSRKSDATIVDKSLKLKKPKFSSDKAPETKRINDHTIRLYLNFDSVDTVLDTFFVVRKEVDEWMCIDTVLRTELDEFFHYQYKGCYLVDDRNVPSAASGEFFYRIIGKGKVNAVSTDVVSESPLEVPGFTFVEGSDVIPSFYISIYEATKEWPPESGGPADCSNGPEPNRTIRNGVNWSEAKDFCDFLTDKYSVEGFKFRLPSEDEWEYAAKRDIFKSDTIWSDYEYPWGSNQISHRNANYMNSGDPCDNTAPYLTPAGYYNGENGTIDSHSPFGVYDMGGNILEWCQDSYGSREGWKLLKGGAYFHDPDLLKVSERFGLPDSTKAPGIGFRIVMEDF